MGHCYAVWWTLVVDDGENLENIEGIYSTLQKAQEVRDKLNNWSRENDPKRYFYINRYSFDNMNVI